MHPPVMIVFFSTSLRTTSSSIEDAKELNFLARMALIVLAFIPRCAVSFMLLSLRCASQPRQRQPLLSPWRHGRYNVRHRQGRSSPQMDERNRKGALGRSEEQTSELQSLMRITYSVFCLHKKTNK